jgi:hypothetical protein
VRTQHTLLGSIVVLAVITLPLLLVAAFAFGCGGTLTSSQTAPATAQTTLPDDNTYGARVQVWLDTYAADLEKAFAEQGDPVDSWKGTPQQLAFAGATADLAHEAINSLRAIVPPSRWAGAQAAYVEALDRIARDFDDLARGDLMSAGWGWPLSQFLVEARQTFTSEVLGIPASVAVAPTTTPPTTIPPATQAAWGGVQAPSAQVVSVLKDRIEAWNSGDGQATAAFYAMDAVLVEADNGLVTEGQARIAARLQGLMDVFKMEEAGPPLQLGSLVIEPVNLLLEGQPGLYVLVFSFGPSDREIYYQWVLPAGPWEEPSDD